MDRVMTSWLMYFLLWFRVCVTLASGGERLLACNYHGKSRLGPTSVWLDQNHSQYNNITASFPESISSSEMGGRKGSG